MLTIYEQYHPEIREEIVYEHKITTEGKILKLKMRIQTLEGRQPLKENQAIVRKLRRELARLEKELSK